MVTLSLRHALGARTIGYHIGQGMLAESIHEVAPNTDCYVRARLSMVTHCCLPLGFEVVEQFHAFLRDLRDRNCSGEDRRKIAELVNTLASDAGRLVSSPLLIIRILISIWQFSGNFETG
ncbi:hypothetical protein MN608_06047 [Microdochium nivale]|nr:hypothetical protein MN608_06047 [Microdochium nivale]